MSNALNEYSDAYFRFYGELKDFLTYGRRNTSFSYRFKGNPSVKDTIEALGVPHVEVDCILVNGKPVDFSYQTKQYDRVCVYPAGKFVRIAQTSRLKNKPAKKPKFILDSHLGKLAKHLRLLGFDALYKKDFPDNEIVRIARRDKRVVLTRDIGLLKNKTVDIGRWIRATNPGEQIKEVVKVFCLSGQIDPFKICLECNNRIRRIAKRRIINRLPPLTKDFYSTFYICRRCRKIYWPGSHYAKLNKFVARIRRQTSQRNKERTLF